MRRVPVFHGIIFVGGDVGKPLYEDILELETPLLTRSGPFASQKASANL